MGKVITLNALIQIRNDLRKKNKKVVFTNGCFDILHKGHVDYLNKAKELGDVLIVGMNTDISVRQIKGSKRPVVPEDERAYILSNLCAVDYVCMFNETTPLNLISTILPDYLIKGADWSIDNVVGREEVEKHGGKVLTIELTPNRSTTNIIQKILEIYQS